MKTYRLLSLVGSLIFTALAGNCSANELPDYGGTFDYIDKLLRAEARDGTNEYQLMSDKDVDDLGAALGILKDNVQFLPETRAAIAKAAPVFKSEKGVVFIKATAISSPYNAFVVRRIL